MVLCWFTLSAVAATAWAQPREDRQDRREIGRDRRAARDDRHDRQFLEDLISRFDDARSRRDLAEMDGVDRDFLTAIRFEIAESQRELKRARRELRRSRREARRAEVTGEDPIDAENDRRDDRRDLVAEKRALDAAIRIEREYNRLTRRRGPRAIDRKRQVLEDALGLAAFEQRENRRELREDRRERREDRNDGAY